MLRIYGCSPFFWFDKCQKRRRFLTNYDDACSEAQHTIHSCDNTHEHKHHRHRLKDEMHLAENMKFLYPTKSRLWQSVALLA